MKVYVLNGPNLNLLGVREPDQYGTERSETLLELIGRHCAQMGIEAVCRQTNHEGVLVDWIQEAYFAHADGIVINPGAYTHTSVALLDALKAVRLPAVEVHISRIEEREAFRQISYLRAACKAVITGHGLRGYLEAIDLLDGICGKEHGE